MYFKYFFTVLYQTKLPFLDSFSPSYSQPTSLQLHPQLCHLTPNPFGILLLRLLRVQEKSRSYGPIR